MMQSILRSTGATTSTPEIEMGIREPWVQGQSLSVAFLRLSRQASLRLQIGELVQEGRRAGASAQGRSVEVFGRRLSVFA